MESQGTFWQFVTSTMTTTHVVDMTGIQIVIVGLATYVAIRIMVNAFAILVLVLRTTFL